MNVLGLCLGEFCSAALIVDDQLVGASYEERFHRKKYISGFPTRAVKYFFKKSNLSSKDIDKVMVMNETVCGLHFALIQRLNSFSVGDFLREAYEYYKPVLLDKKQISYLDVFKDKIQSDVFPENITKRLLEEGESKENSQEIRSELIKKMLGDDTLDIDFVEHHSSHAHYGLLYAPKEFTKALVFTADSFGDYSNANVYCYNDGQLSNIHSSGVQNLGRLFRNITLLLGMKPYQHEFKVMGLAPYAAPEHANECKRIFATFMTGFDKGEWQFNKVPEDNYFSFKVLLDGFRFDNIAGGLQAYFEDMLSEWFEYYIKQHDDFDNIVFSGGLSMNVKANLCLEELACRYGKKFFAAPSGNDFSHCISAAYTGLIKYGDSDNNREYVNMLSSLDLGYYFDDEEIHKMCDWANSQNWYIDDLDIKNVASELSKGRILALCHGSAEFGERALGFRSIISDPREVDTIRRINIAIKKRDFWMPFAPAILEEHANDYLDIKDVSNHYYMASAARTINSGKLKLKAAIHPYDQTSRPQIVSSRSNPLFYDIINQFGKITDTYALLNTSLNLHGFPIVNDADDLIFVLENSQLDGCILENKFIIRA